jgi:hypothetical protein
MKEINGRMFCDKPDRDVPGIVCGFPIPCPYHTFVIDNDKIEYPSHTGLIDIDHVHKIRDALTEQKHE